MPDHLPQQNGAIEGNNSLQRFADACDMVKQYESALPSKTLVDHSFDILNKVSQGSFTKWSIVYDVSNKKIYFKTEQFSDIKSIELSSVDFSCKATPKAKNLNEVGAGDISKNLASFTTDLNREIVRKALEQSQSKIRVRPDDQEATILYPSAISCK